MEQHSNAEKQARYRKKEQLKRQAGQILRKWQSEPWKHHLKSLEEVNHLIEAAIKLPSGWTEEDYLNAEKRLYHVYSEVVSPVNQLSNDVRESRNIAYESIRRPADLPKINADLARAEEKTNALAFHIISALKLSGCNEADQAAALMEAMRFVGRNLTNNEETPSSQATAMCLTTVNPICTRPTWYVEKLVNMLSQHLHPDLLQEIAQSLINNTPEKDNEIN